MQNKFEPKNEQAYYTLCFDHGWVVVGYSRWEGCSADKKSLENNGIFETRELAQKCANRLNVVFAESQKVQTPFVDRIEKNDTYFWLDEEGNVVEACLYYTAFDYMCIHSGNCFETTVKAEESKAEFIKYNNNIWNIGEYLKWLNKEKNEQNI